MHSTQNQGKNAKFAGIPKQMIHNGQGLRFLPRKTLIRKDEPFTSG